MTSLLNDLKVSGISAGQDVAAGPLSPEELRKMHAFWRACNYLAAGMIYLRDNPLLREPLKEEHVKKRLLGHWGASPGLSLAYVHLNRLINKYDLDAIFLAGPEYVYKLLVEYGLDLAHKVYLLADPFSVPRDLSGHHYLVHDPSFSDRSAVVLTGEYLWLKERIGQIGEALRGRGRPLVPASRYLNVLAAAGWR